ncbi:hypothetical protein UVI_02015410 [Ustilaginoidea virens]|uniref:Protein kinase domain-containing protein n=1 Tax=Ustilaginoidea virens TaxID=1159556 RepID=A0A1B5KRY4_USTVR|nr:hypothetical protein UVI_02015410 [Ustilaginoidea virens]
MGGATREGAVVYWTPCLAIEHLTQRFRPPNFVGYVYFDMNEFKPADIVGCLIKQCVLYLNNSKASEELKAANLLRNKGSEGPGFTYASRILWSLLVQARRVFLVFDAVDQYPGHSEDFVHKLLETMGMKHINVFMTSRVALSSKKLFVGALRLEVRARDEDISTLLWAKLAMDELESHQALSEARLDELLRDLPADMVKLYTRILERLMKRDQFCNKIPRTYSDLRDKLCQHPLLQYAALYWGYHARNCYKDVEMEVLGFLNSQCGIATSGLVMAQNEEYPGRYDEAYEGMLGIHLASACGLTEVAAHLIRNRVDLESQTEGNWTALHWLSRLGLQGHIFLFFQFVDPRRVQMLIQMTTKLDRWTALHLAAKGGHLPVMEVLVQHGAALDSVDAQGRTPLHLACWFGHIPVVCFLLCMGADPNIQNIHGMTALHCASRAGNLNLVRELVGSRRQKLDIQDTLGLTALDEAIRKNHEQVVRFLSRAGAIPGTRKTPRHLEEPSATPIVWKNVPRDFNWKTYQVDKDKTLQIKQGAQCSCEVLVQPGSPDLRVFRKTFIITKEAMEMNDEYTSLAHGKSGQKYSLSERQILDMLQHPHVVLYLDSDSDPEMNAFLLYMEYCDMGDLQQAHGLDPKVQIKDKTDRKLGFWQPKPGTHVSSKALNGAAIWGLLWQLSSALAYLHYGLSLHHDAEGPCQCRFERDWKYVIHRDVKPANEFRDLMAGCVKADERDRPSSLDIMQLAYQELAKSKRLHELPDVVTDEMESVHSYLAAEKGKYWQRAIRLVAELLDDDAPYGGEGTKEHRRLTLKRLKALFEDISDDAFEEDTYEYSLHLLVLLDDFGWTDSDESGSEPEDPDQGFFSKLSNLLSSGSDPNAAWEVSGWTALHLAAQEGKEAVFGLLLGHGADAHRRDAHGTTAMEYAERQGLTVKLEQLALADMTGPSMREGTIIHHGGIVGAGSNLRGVLSSFDKTSFWRY